MERIPSICSPRMHMVKHCYAQVASAEQGLSHQRRTRRLDNTTGSLPLHHLDVQLIVLIHDFRRQDLHRRLPLLLIPISIRRQPRTSGIPHSSLRMSLKTHSSEPLRLSLGQFQIDLNANHMQHNRHSKSQLELMLQATRILTSRAVSLRP